jgi:hypothetical protein
MEPYDLEPTIEEHAAMMLDDQNRTERLRIEFLHDEANRGDDELVF